MSYTKLFEKQRCDGLHTLYVKAKGSVAECAQLCQEKSGCDIFTYNTQFKRCQIFNTTYCKDKKRARIQENNTTIYEIGAPVKTTQQQAEVDGLNERISTLQKQLQISEQQDKLHQLALGGQSDEISQLENQLKIAKMKKELADLGNQGTLIILL